MGTEDRKHIAILLNNGNSINLVTRAPYGTIEEELFDSMSDWIDLSGIDGSPEENPVRVRFMRTLLAGAIIGKFIPPVRQQQQTSRFLQ